MNQKYFKIILVLTILIGMFQMTQAQAESMGRPIAGQVYDKETRKPIKDVLVIVTWNTRNKWDVNLRGTILDAAEMLVDENGKFDFQKKTFKSKRENVHLFFYKKGYFFTGVSFFNQGRYHHPDDKRWNQIQQGVFFMEKLPEGKSEAGNRISLGNSIYYRGEHYRGEESYKFAGKIPEAVKIMRSR